MALRVVLFGRPGIEGEGGFAPFTLERRFQLLVYLACVRDWVDRERLAALFWPDHGAEAARRNLRQVVHRLHETAGIEGLEMRRNMLRWQVATDLNEFDARLTRNDFEGALRLYRGGLLQDFENGASVAYCEWLRGERLRCAHARRDAVLALMAAQDPKAALPLAQSLLADDGLDEDALAASVQALLALGRRAAAEQLVQSYAVRLASELGIEPPAHIRNLLHGAAPAAAVASTSVTGERTAAAGVGPTEPPDFVGRRAELRALVQLLGGPPAGLVTLHGPGGIGKSRLAQVALQAVERAARSRRAICWVELADLDDSALLGPRIAAQLGLRGDEDPDPWAAVLKHLAVSDALLALDSAEHLADLAVHIERLRAACPRVTVLVTSRTRLQLAGERVFELEGLPYPDEDDAAETEVALSFDAVRLFAQRARRARGDFDVDREIAHIVEITHRVQGMPLALELAAAWVRLLPPAEIARELRLSIDVLERDTSPDVRTRSEHVSMRATLQRSWDLLAPREREGLAALAHFRGGFTRDAASAVAGLALPLLASLVDKSLVTAPRDGGRFAMHPLVAAFAADQAAQRPDNAASVRQRHARYFAAWAQGLGKAANSNPGAVASALNGELDNLRAAWQHAVAARSGADVSDLCKPLADYFEVQGRFGAGIELFEQALALAESEVPAAVMRVHRSLATLQFRRGAHERAEQHARTTMRIARRIGDAASLKAALNVIGLSRWRRNDFERAVRWFRRLNLWHCLLPPTVAPPSRSAPR